MTAKGAEPAGALPEPLTPIDCDLRDFHRMMIDISRLRQSDFDATPDDSAWRAGLNLWFSAWHSVPAGSLSNDEAALAKAAGLGRDLRTWRKVREGAMHGFLLCSDGRIYHETVCEMALEAWLEKLAQRLSSGAGNAKRWKVDFDPALIEGAIEIAAEMLSRIAPQSKALQKAKRRQSRPADPGSPDGTEKSSHRDAETVPSGSQEKGTETGNKREESNDPSLAASAPAARSKGSKGLIPKGYPDAAAIAEAQGWIAEAGVKLDAAAQAKRFRSHALSNGRKLADWSEAWRGWIDIACEDAPPAPAAAKPIERTWDGPQEIWDRCVRLMGEGQTGSYLGLSRWQVEPPAILAQNGFAADVLRKAGLGVTVIAPERKRP